MNDNLPPLPEPKFQGEPKDSNGLFTHWFIEEQMLEYGQLCRQQALEEAAQAIHDGEPLINRAGYAAFIRSLK